MSELNIPEINISSMLPFGTALRPLLMQSCLSDADMNTVLRKRGVYVGNADKMTLIPLMLSMVFSPREFEMLQESQGTKEDSPKRRNSSINGNTDAKLFSVLKDYEPDAKLIESQNPNVLLNTPLSFDALNENKLIMNYEIIRQDLTKDWVKPNSKHVGKVIIEKGENKQIQICNEYTSKETDDINRQIIKEVVSFLFSRKEISDNEKTIKAEDFDNRRRFNFLLQLAQSTADMSLEFSEIRDVELGPDPQNPPRNPNSIIQENVRKLIINGSALEKNIALTADQDKDNLILRSLEVTYLFNFRGTKGKCTLQYGFMHFFRSQNTSKEFQVALLYCKPIGSVNKRALESFILEQFDILKEKVYQSFIEPKSIQ